MYDRAIKFFASVLAGLLIFLFGYLAAIVVLRPDAAMTLSTVSAPGGQGVDSGAAASDLTTKRVKTIAIRPEVAAAPAEGTPSQP